MLVAGSVAAAGLTAAPMASAQGVDIRQRPQHVGLVISQPRSSLETFSSAKTYTTSFNVEVTTSSRRRRSIADGEVTAGSKIGRLANGSRAPAVAARGSRRQVVGVRAAGLRHGSPPREVLDDPGQRRGQGRPAPEDRDQTSGGYRKLLLVTLSSNTP